MFGVPEDVLLSVIAGVFSVIGTIGGVMLQRALSRIDKLEDEVSKRITKDDARVLVADKVEPIKDKIDDVDKKLDKIIDIMLHKHN